MVVVTTPKSFKKYKKCGYCGHVLDDVTEKCPFCGKHLESRDIKSSYSKHNELYDVLAVSAVILLFVAVLLLS